MKLRAALAVSLLLVAGSVYFGMPSAPVVDGLQEVVIEVRLEDGALVADPDRATVRRGQRVDWDNTLGGDIEINFARPGLFADDSRELRGRRVGQTRGRAIGLIRGNAQQGTYKYDIVAFDTDGNRYELDPELDCC